MTRPMMSIAIFTYSTKPRGSVVHATHLAEALTRAGCDVTLYALGKPGACLYRPVACHVQVFPAGEAPTEIDALIRQRTREFVNGFRAREMRHDIFHAQDCLAANALLASRSPRMSPIVRTVHHVDRFESPYLASCQRRSILDVDAVFSVSRLTQRNVYEEFGRSAMLVRNGVDPLRFKSPPPRGRDWLRARFDVDAEDLVVLSVGGVEPRKNTRRALAAVARACERCPRLSWIIVGGDSIWGHSEYRSAFDADLARLPSGLATRVVRTGTIDEGDMTALYALSDVLLCPSEQEGFGLCVLEAMSAGTPVIVPGREPFTEYLDERSAVLVDCGSVDSIASALTALLLDPNLRSRLVPAARQRAAQFSWARSAATHLTHYQNVRPIPDRRRRPHPRFTDA
jgi:glycosyltransferase-like protein